MKRSIVSDCLLPDFPRRTASASSKLSLVALGLALAALALGPARSQVLTIDTSGKGTVASNGPVDRQYQQVQPTQVALSTEPLGTRDRLALVRVMQAEQGFAMRPLPGGHKGLTLEANGKLVPAGEAYLNMVTSDGLSVKPGGRVVITDIRIDHNKLVFDLNDGPDAKHRFLRHISIGTDTTYNTPVVADSGTQSGSRVTLVFKNHVPDLSGEQVKALLAPLISFDVKTPVQAYTDTLPKPLKEAILDHQVLVGMNTDMVIFAKSQPQEKYHEMDGQMPVDIWIYGKPPEDVTFVRINGNRVIRVELARIGQPLQVFTKDVVADMMRASGQLVTEQAENVHVIQEGDVQRNPDTQAPAPPPSLRKPGDTAPTDGSNNGQVMKPVHFPTPQPDSQADPYPNGQGQGSQQGTGQSSAQAGTAPASTTAKPAGSAQGQQPGASSQPASSSQPGTSSQPATVGKNPDDDQN